MKNLKKLAGAIALSIGAIGSAHAAPVALELSLVIDVSGSINATEYNLQRTGYKNAFLDAGVQSGIMSFSGSGGVAVNVIQFATNAVESIGWTLLDSVASITAFANQIGAMARNGTISTATDVQDGMSLAIASLNNNNYEGVRRVIDVSGDGHQNIDPACSVSATGNYGQACTAVQTQRNAATIAGIRINGLAIEGDYGTNGLTNWYNTNVRTSDGFVQTATGFDTFEAAVTTKIGREITEVPEPASLALFGIALAGLGFAGRRTRKA